MLPWRQESILFPPSHLILDILSSKIFFWFPRDRILSDWNLTAGNPYWRGKHCTVNLLVLTSFDQLLLIMLTLITFFHKTRYFNEEVNCNQVSLVNILVIGAHIVTSLHNSPLWSGLLIPLSRGVISPPQCRLLTKCILNSLCWVIYCGLKIPQTKWLRTITVASCT